MASKNRRRHLRTKAQNLVAHVRIGDKSVLAPVEDISIGGALLRTNEPVNTGTVLSFDVARPGLKRPLRLMGLVVDARVGRGLAVRFNGLDKESNDRLVELMRDLGAMVSSPLVDAPDPPITIAPPRPQTQGSMSAVSAQTFQSPPQTGTGAPDEAQRLMVQLRGAIMEIGKLQEQLGQKDREINELKDKVTRSEGEAKKGGAAETLVGKLEMEKQKAEQQLQELRTKQRDEVDAVKREAQSVMAAMGRLIDVLNRFT